MVFVVNFAADVLVGQPAAPFTVTPDTTASEDDLLVMFCSKENSTLELGTLPTGWAHIASSPQEEDGIQDCASGLVWKLAGASEPSSYDFQGDGGSQYNWGIWRITGHDLATPIHKDAGSFETGVTDPVGPEIITTIDGCMILSCIGMDASGGVEIGIPGATWTDDGGEIPQEAPFQYSAFAHKEQTGAGAIKHTWLTGANDDDRSHIIVAILPGDVTPKHETKPSDDITTSGWTSTPLFSKVDEDVDSPDATVISATAS